MRVVTITDTKDKVLAFDLVDILRLLEPASAHTDGSLANVEATGEGAEDLHRLADNSVIDRVTARLRNIAEIPADQYFGTGT